MKIAILYQQATPDCYAPHTTDDKNGLPIRAAEEGAKAKGCSSGLGATVPTRTPGGPRSPVSTLIRGWLRCARHDGFGAHGQGRQGLEQQHPQGHRTITSWNWKKATKNEKKREWDNKKRAHRN